MTDAYDNMTDSALDEAVALRLGWNWYRVPLPLGNVRLFCRPHTLSSLSFSPADGSEPIDEWERRDPRDPVSHYSTDIAAAFGLVEKWKGHWAVRSAGSFNFCCELHRPGWSHTARAAKPARAIVIAWLRMPATDKAVQGD